MKRNVYCVKDTLVNNCMAPCLGDSDEGMRRSFGDVVRKGDSPISEHPEDYCLLKVGRFDDSTGELEPLSVPVVVAHATDFGRKE